MTFSGNFADFDTGTFVSDSGEFTRSEPKRFATRHQLSSRYPGVEFRGSDDTAEIDSGVHILAGAVTTLSSKLQIKGTSEVGSDPIISGGHIDCSTIIGSVSDGKMKNSQVRKGESLYFRQGAG
jgi:hypothetical protein